MVKLRKILWLTAILSGLSSPGFSDSHGGRSLSLSYDTFIGGILAGSFDIVIVSRGGGYHIKSTARSHGMLDFFIEFRGQNESQGQVVNGRARPVSYQAVSSWAGEARTAEIQYGPNDRLRYQAVPPAKDDERETVPANLLPGTRDPLSALYDIMLGLPETTPCVGLTKIFDGRRRYDVSFSEATGVSAGVSADLSADATATSSVYSGPVRVCRARRKMLAGASRRNLLPQFTRPDWMDIWIAKVRPGLPILPVRVHADLGIADLVVHLVAIGGRKRPPGDSGSTPATGNNHGDSEQ